MGKQPFFIFFIALLCIIGGIRLSTSWQQNQATVSAIAHLSTTTSCAIDETRLQWTNDSPAVAPNSYLQAVFASAANTKVLPPTEEEWERDPRLYHWFMAQTAVKNQAYVDSLSYLRAADAGYVLDATGHWADTEACSVINWTIASEIGYRQPPGGYIQHLMNHKQYEDIVEAFTRLLRYDSERTIWRLSLAKAYVEMENTTMAEEILIPILQEGTAEEIDEANKLLSSTP